MKFEVDNQTLKDLDIFPTIKGEKSVFDLFNFTHSLGGKNKLQKFLSSPSSSLEEITDRKEIISYLHIHFPQGLNIDKDSLGFAEYYFKQKNYSTRQPSKYSAMGKVLMNKLSSEKEYYLIEKGVNSTINLLKLAHRFVLQLTEKLISDNCPKQLQRDYDKLQDVFSFSEYTEAMEAEKLTAYEITKYDYIFRYANRLDMLYIFDLIYEYDAYFAIAKAAKEYNLTYPTVLPQTDNCLEIEGLFHPLVSECVSNDTQFGNNSNLLFVTGPNMAGKSTFLKALSISVYLAHAGFPVPATKMRLSVLSGICTTINISDDLSAGYSHFYAEVLRIKHIIAQLNANKNMLIIFDELFRGTNVKDAYDGTLAIVSAFAKIRSSFFVISTHIVEVAKELTADNIMFAYFEIDDIDGQPVYTYKLREGVSETRLGMYIIRKERLIELINDITN